MALGRSSSRVIVVTALAVAAGACAWLLVRHLDPGSGPSSTAASSSTDVNAQSLQALVTAIGRPVYWAGPQHGVTYEFTETADHRIYVRYLPKGVAAGTARPYLTVASYPVANAFGVTRSAAGAAGTVTLPSRGGGVAFYSEKRPTNVYLAFRHEAIQIEVYGPDVRTLRALVENGRIRRVAGASAVAAGTVRTRATTTSEQALVRLKRALNHPIFWLGAIPGRKLELSRSPDGRIYLRYLPVGAAPGARAPYLTVATYPVANAFTAAKRAASKPDTVAIPLPHGAIAFYSKARPTNVYAAFPGSGEQIEIYDPSAKQARQLVAAAKLKAVS